MAAQSRKGGGTWSTYMRQQAFRLGWQSYQGGLPFDDDYAKRMFPGHPVSHDAAISIQRTYEAGRLMAAESGLPLPPPDRRRSQAILKVVHACPAMCRQFATEQSLAREETARANALRLRLMAKQKSDAALAMSRTVPK